MVELCEGLKIPWPLRLCGFKSRFEYDVSFTTPCKLMACREFFFMYINHGINKKNKFPVRRKIFPNWEFLMT